MGIDPVSTTQSIYRADAKERTKGQAGLVETVQEKSVPASTAVSISDEGLNKAQQQKEYPLEYYAVPKWYADIYTVHLQPKLGMSGAEYDKAFDNINTLSASDRDYYQEAKHRHWQELMSENDLLDDQEKYYQAVIANKESSEQLRLQWEEKLSSDARLMAIFEKGKHL